MVRAFSLIEAMIVVAIIGLLAALAVPSLTPLATHYRALEDARGVLAAVNQGRGLAQRNNEPIEVGVAADRLILRTPLFADGMTPESIRKLITGFVDERIVHLPPGARIVELQLTAGVVTTTVPAGNAGAAFRFCPSSDTYFRTAVGEKPVCGVGNLASHSALVIVETHEQRFIVDIRAALGSVDLRQVR